MNRGVQAIIILLYQEQSAIGIQVAPESETTQAAQKRIAVLSSHHVPARLAEIMDRHFFLNQ